jgi:hypothetical protein
MVDVYICAGSHLLTDVEARLQSVDEAIGEPDALFIEARQQESSIKSRLLNWLATPLLLIGINAWLNLLDFAGMFLSNDREIIVELENWSGSDSIEVDKPVHKTIGEVRGILGLANYSLILVPSILMFISQAQAVVILSVLLLTAGMASSMLHFLACTNHERNYHMITEVRRISQNEGFEHVCLVVGEHHEGGIRQIAGELEEVQIHNEG